MRSGLLVLGVLLAFTPVVSAVDPNEYPFTDPPDYCAWARVEYLYWLVRRTPMPAVLTTNSTGANAVLTNSQTSILYGNEPVDYGGLSGGRFTIGSWFDHLGILGYEASYMGLQQGSTGASFATNGAGSPLLAFPFTNAATGAASATNISNPGTGQTGTVVLNNKLDMWSAQGDIIITRGRSSCFEVNRLVGARFLQLEEVFNFTATSSGTVTSQLSSFATRNQFIGGSIGSRCTVRHECYFLEATGRVGIGAMQERVQISGANAGGTIAGGPYAYGTNIGTYERTKFAVIPEAQARLGYEASSHLKLWVGADFLYISNLVRPGDQINTTLDPARAALTGATTTNQPTFSFKETSFFAYGINAGVELRY